MYLHAHTQQSLLPLGAAIISKTLDTPLTKYDNVFLMGDFDVNKNDARFCQLCNSAFPEGLANILDEFT